MTEILSTAQALQLLDDPKQSTAVREAAVHYLGEHHTPANLARLVDALEDDEFGVRWAAAATLALVGDVGLEPLLRGLMQKHTSAWLREGVYHILYYNTSDQVSNRTVELQKALKGPAAEVATLTAAEHLLMALEREKQSA